VQILFWIFTGIIGYVYVGYPLALACGLIARRLGRAAGGAVAAVAGLSSVSVIVAAHNEEAAIEAKIRNILAADYPRELVEILIGSDGSSDGTEEIVRRYAGEGVGLISFPVQQGKSAIQNGLVAASSGDVLVFTDADCEIGPGALRALVARLDDSKVGLVTACPSYANVAENPVTENEGIYLRYESWIRRQESERGLLAMASGSLFAMRRSLWRPLDRNLGDDFELPLRVALAGARNVAEPGASVITRLSQNDHGSMFALKVRIVSKDFRALRKYRALLNPFRHFQFAVALWSHKLLRWLVPYFLLGMLGCAVVLMHSSFYRAFVVGLLSFFTMAAVGSLLGKRKLGLPWSVPASFCTVNLAAFFGILKSFGGRGSGTWTPVRN
jgi:cellulose synthase/poly-beta-1,6-N-acetylglucosamine synthase-like glycosyltransferase